MPRKRPSGAHITILIITTPNAPFATWLLSIAAHYCIDQQRRKRLPTVDLDEIIEFNAEDPAHQSRTGFS